MLKKNTNKTTGFVAATLLALLTLGSSATAVAAQRFDRNQIRRFSKSEVRQIARSNGYQLGVREGRFDAQRNGRFDVKDSRVYRSGMAGYSYQFQNEREYRNAFRDGFEDGYRSGFRSFNRRNGSRDDDFRWNRRGNNTFWPNRRF